MLSKAELRAECVRQARIANGAMREADLLRAKNGELAAEVMRLDDRLERAVDLLRECVEYPGLLGATLPPGWLDRARIAIGGR